MSLIIRGIKINTGETFRKKAQHGINKIKEQFIIDKFRAYISLNKMKSKFFGVKILFTSKEYGIINVKTTDDNAIYALTSSIAKIEKIVRRLHRRIKSKKRIIYKEKNLLTNINNTNFTPNEENNSPIVANMNYKIENLSVAEASNLLINSNLKMLMFRNASHLGLNLLFKSSNGTIEWIDPRGTRESITL